VCVFCLASVGFWFDFRFLQLSGAIQHLLVHLYANRSEMNECLTAIQKRYEIRVRLMVISLGPNVRTGQNKQANYINALAVSVSPFFEPAEVTLGGSFFFPWVDFL
jgi:hypothetical protein